MMNWQDDPTALHIIRIIARLGRSSPHLVARPQRDLKRSHLRYVVWHYMRLLGYTCTDIAKMFSCSTANVSKGVTWVHYNRVCEPYRSIMLHADPVCNYVVTSGGRDVA